MGIRSALGILALTLLAMTAASAAQINAWCYSAKGTVEFAGPGSGHFEPLQKGQSLAAGSTVRTGDDGSAVLVTTPGSAVEIGTNSNLKINELAFAKSGSTVTQRTAIIGLKTGVMSALIDPSTPKITDFRVQTPEGSAAARGTFYAVLVFEGKTYVGVKEGRVAVSAVTGP